MPSHVRTFWWLSVAIVVYWVVSAGWFLAFPSAHQIADLARLDADLRDNARREIFEIVTTMTAIWCAVTLGIAWLAAFRKQGWARWVFVFLFVVRQVGPFFIAAAYGNLLTYLKRRAEGDWFDLNAYVIPLLTVLAIYFVFTGNARDWFESKSRPRVEAR